MKRLLATLPWLALSACIPAARRAVQAPSDLRPGEVLLVGRVKITPPLGKEDQHLSGMAERWRGMALLLVGEAPGPPRQPLTPSEYRGRIEAPLDRDFAVAVPPRPFYLRGGVVHLRLAGEVSDEALLPGGFLVDLRPDDRAVYIGTIHYHRDEFWQITRVDVDDEYERVNAEHRKRWDPAVPLRKALVSLPAPRPR